MRSVLLLIWAYGSNCPEAALPERGPRPPSRVSSHGPVFKVSSACIGHKCPNSGSAQWLQCPVVKLAKEWPAVEMSCDHIGQYWTYWSHGSLIELSVDSTSPDDHIGQWLKCPVVKFARIWPVVEWANGEIGQLLHCPVFKLASVG